MTRYYCTLFDKNYLTRGLALHSSIMHFAQPFKFWILCMDDLTYEILTKLNLPNVILIKLSDFEDKELLKVKPTRTDGEYCWTCTPSLLLYILKHNSNIDIVSYLDSDLYFYSSPEPIFKEVGKDSVMIIPHRFAVGRKEKEKKAGIYNVSMVTFRKDINGLKCLNWWRERCLEWCFNRLENGRLGDQMYLNSFPQLFKDVHVLQNIGAGVGPSNDKQYVVSVKSRYIYIDNFPLIFYHFAGFKIFEPLSFLPMTILKKSTYRQLIYAPYFKEIAKQTKIIREIDPKFNFGFANRPDFLKLLLYKIYDLF